MRQSLGTSGCLSISRGGWSLGLLPPTRAAPSQGALGAVCREGSGRGSQLKGTARGTSTRLCRPRQSWELQLWAAFCRPDQAPPLRFSSRSQGRGGCSEDEPRRGSWGLSRQSRPGGLCKRIPVCQSHSKVRQEWRQQARLCFQAEKVGVTQPTEVPWGAPEAGKG